MTMRQAKFCRNSQVTDSRELQMALMLERTDDLCCEIQEKDNIKIEHVDTTAKEMISDFLLIMGKVTAK